MKKVILKFTGLAVLAAIMVYNVHLYKPNSKSAVTLSYMKNLAFAKSECGPDDHPECGGFNEECARESSGHTVCIWYKN